MLHEVTKFIETWGRLSNTCWNETTKIHDKYKGETAHFIMMKNKDLRFAL
jgi:hypothetical protein